MDVTDELLKNIAAIRTDGNIQPQPSMVVEKASMPEGDIIKIEVQPHVFPPVRYKGRVWIRVGPRKGVASEADEKILMEKRRTSIQSFDSMPCMNATIEDLDLRLFKHYFLPQALDDSVIEEDNRDVRYQLSAFGFFDIRHDCPTNAGMLFFAKTTITNRRPIPVSAAREESVIDYPDWAIRELLMNAICHRDYESNGPIQFYQYADRIEIENHGGLYGRANEQNFPNVNDYRNLIVAEGMKVLGFVNRQSRGVLKVQRELLANENGEAIYDFGFQTAVLVCVKKSLHGDRLIDEAVRNGWLTEKEQKPLELTENEAVGVQKPSKMTENEQKTVKNDGKYDFPNLLVKNVYQVIKINRKVKYSQLEDNLGVSESTILRAITWLKENGYINPERSKIKGEWQLIK